jgi:hypothetical protein
MAKLTRIYIIKYSGKDAGGHRVTKLYKPDGEELTDHELDVEPDDGVVFVFTVPSDGEEQTLRFNEKSDPAKTPRCPISWAVEGLAQPAWITVYDPVNPPYKTLSMVVENIDPKAERRAIFNLNLFDTLTQESFTLRIHGAEMPLDPTIVEKAPGPPHG